ncbi:LapA family protein [Celerinatantimonas sp. YJH-8]|uniref:LapA family protein n=1 Tax=Celerinatantimonas sp. YJH-8 TaxID=3228714 RepID=UPI0038C8BD70
MKAIGILVLVIILFVLALAIGGQNDQIIRVHYLIAQGNLRISWLMAIMFILGFVIACLGLGFFYLKVRLQLMQFRRQFRKQQRELQQLQSKLTGD